MSTELFHILLVEDNVADIYLYREALQGARLNFELTVLRDGREALDFVQGAGKYRGHTLPDLAILDFSLPKHNGGEVLEAIRLSERFSTMPVVLTSSSTLPGDPAVFERLGIERYIAKPPDLEEFLSIGGVLKEILLQGKSRREAGRGQKMANGFSGEPVPSAIRNGAAENKNS